MLDVLILSVYSGVKNADFGWFFLGDNFGSVSLVGIIMFAVLVPLIVKFKKIHPILFIAVGAVLGILFGM